MNLVPRTLVEWLGPLLRRLMMFGFQVESEEVAADLVEKGNAARLRGAKSSIESIELLNQLDSGDEAKAEVVAIFRQCTVEQARLIQRLMNEPQPASVSTKAMDRPFSDATPIGRASKPESEPDKAKGNELDGVVQPKRRGRGRPRKDEQRPA